MSKAWVLGLAVLLASSQMPATAGQGLDRKIDPDMLTEGFLGAHPDIRWQRKGMHSFERGQYEIRGRENHG